MSVFERIAEERSSLFEPAKGEGIDEQDERIWGVLLEGREPTGGQKLEFMHALREEILNGLLSLEKIRKRQKQATTEYFETLRFMIWHGYLNERGKGDANIFLHIEDVVRDEALSQIAFLRETDKTISAFESAFGYSEEEVASRAKVRRQHESACEAEWGVQ